MCVKQHQGLSSNLPIDERVAEGLPDIEADNIRPILLLAFGLLRHLVQGGTTVAAAVLTLAAVVVTRGLLMLGFLFMMMFSGLITTWMKNLVTIISIKKKTLKITFLQLHQKIFIHIYSKVKWPLPIK